MNTYKKGESCFLKQMDRGYDEQGAYAITKKRYGIKIADDVWNEMVSNLPKEILLKNNKNIIMPKKMI